MPTGFTLSFGAYADPSFVGMKGIVTRSAALVDGSGNVSQTTWTVTIAGDGTASVSGLPYNDDGTTYRCDWQALSYKPSPGNRVFQVLSSSGITTQDFDQLPATPSVSSGPPVVPLVTSVVGQTGAVTGAQIAADPALRAASVNVSGSANNPVTSATAARPTGLTKVFWQTPTQPTNWITGDEWINNS